MTIPALQADTQELNAFLRGNRVLTVERHLIEPNGIPYWTFCIQVLDGTAASPAIRPGSAPKVDYREVLSESEFRRYAALREVRKQMAEREGVPPYALFTNEQLAHMVQNNVTTKQAMEAIPGVGKSRIAKYAESFLALLRQESAS